MVIDVRIVYLILNEKITTTREEIYVNDIATVISHDAKLRDNIEEIQVKKIEENKCVVINGWEIISIITEAWDDVAVFLQGSQNVLVHYDKQGNQKKSGKRISVWLKGGFITILCFFGAAFTIMAFENDVGTSTIFQGVYMRITGRESNGATLLEFGYSIGLFSGILYFFHHFGKRKGNSDPTPVEVAMLGYKKDVLEAKKEKTENT